MKRPSILIVEDDQSMAQLFLVLSAKHGLNPTLAGDGLEAVKTLRGPKQFDLLLTDFNLPQMDGVTLLNWCRENGFHMPVIFSTASRVLLKREELALGDCCATLLAKPFTNEQFKNAIEISLAKVHSKNCQKRNEC